jgi:uncharacterized protein
VQWEAQRLIDRLALVPHPEGGFYRETFRSAHLTSIYYLLSAQGFSGFHQLPSDEIWHHHHGAAVAIEVIDADGRARQLRIGDRDRWQAVIPAGSWFAAHLANGEGYALVSCDVAPPFAFADFKLAQRNDLIARFVQHRELIERWTR